MMRFLGRVLVAAACTTGALTSGCATDDDIPETAEIVTEEEAAARGMVLEGGQEDDAGAPAQAETEGDG